MQQIKIHKVHCIYYIQPKFCLKDRAWLFGYWMGHNNMVLNYISFSSNNSFAVIYGGLRDLSWNLPSTVLKSVCIGSFRFLTTLIHFIIRVCSLWIFGRVILLSTGSHFKRVNFNVSPICVIKKACIGTIFKYLYMYT